MYYEFKIRKWIVNLVVVLLLITLGILFNTDREAERCHDCDNKLNAAHTETMYSDNICLSCAWNLYSKCKICGKAYELNKDYDRGLCEICFDENRVICFQCEEQRLMEDMIVFKNHPEMQFCVDCITDLLSDDILVPVRPD